MRGRFGGALISAKHGDVGTRPEVDEYWILFAFRLVVFLKLRPQTPRLGAHNGILAGMIGRFAVINLGSYHIFLKFVCVSGEGIFDSEAEKAPQPPGLQEGRALQQPLELGPDFQLGEILRCVLFLQRSLFLA
jgi:hypothetical protein